MKHFIAGAALTTFFALMMIGQLAREFSAEVCKLKARVDFCDSINEINRVNDSLLKNTYDPARKFGKNYLEGKEN